MSQITRCPSCATSFKVVADQLRISEGWVRCGQCKEVFDASAHLLPSAPPSLLPDVSLTDAKPPPAPVARASEAGRAWGVTPPAHPPVAAPVAPTAPAAHTAPPTAPTAATGLGAATRTAQQAASRLSEPAALPPRSPAPPAALASEPAASLPVPSPVAPSPLVMDVPTPAVPAFLTAGMPGSTPGELSLEPVTPFAWRPPLPTPAAAALHAAVREAVVTKQPLPAAPTPAVWSPPLRDVPPPAFADTEPASLDSLDLPPVGRRAPDASAQDAEMVPGGYELPFADLRDSGWPDEALPADEPSVGLSPAPALVSASVDDELAFPAIDASATTPLAASGPGQRRSYTAPRPSTTAVGTMPPSESVGRTERAEAALPPVDFAPPAPSQSAESLTLVADDSAAAVLRADARKSSVAQDGTDEDADPEHEVSFVRAARRQAVWRRPAVRLVLTLLALTALVALALQVAVQERDLIAAMDARARPWLVKLCAPLRCEIAPQRQIADVVIDSSSFNKARGDSYQLALTMKSLANIPLATPAIELTLTDAQDQPVLRRVLLPTDMAAPAELPARGEWSASVAVIVTTGGARVAGYRLLAFYP